MNYSFVYLNNHKANSNSKQEILKHTDLYHGVAQFVCFYTSVTIKIIEYYA